MTRGFGPGGPRAEDEEVTVGGQNTDAGASAYRIADEFVPDRGFKFPVPGPEDLKLQERIARLIAEGIQALEHASLISTQMHTAMGSLDYATTRRGRAALQRGEIQSILAAANA